MIRRALTTVALASVTVVLLPGVAVADNCSGLTDCYGSARSAAGAAAGMALIIGLAVLAAPALLRGARPESKPDSTDHKPPGRAPDDVMNVEVPGVEEEPLRFDEKVRRPDSTDHKRPGRAPGGVMNVEVPGVEEEPLRFGEKVRIDMAVRGWTREVVAELARHPDWTFATRDRRYNLDGSRASQPATWFVRADGLYVVINNVTHDVVQVGAGPLDGTPTGPTDPSWTESLRGRVAALSGGSDVRFAGHEPCYPVRGAPAAIDWCLRNRVRVLGLEGLVLAEGRLVPQLDTILDCSAERNPGGAGTVAKCGKRARTLIRKWSAIENCFVILTLERGTGDANGHRLLGKVGAVVAAALVIGTVTAILLDGGRGRPTANISSGTRPSSSNTSPTLPQETSLQSCSTDTSTCALGDRDLSLQSTGPDVAELQHRLQYLGFFEATVYGYFGPVTEAAVKAFQTCAGLTPDGVADVSRQGTIPAIRQASPASVKCTLGDRDLSFNSTGPDVTELQHRLQYLGFFEATVYGYFGPVTEAAVKAFQTCAGLTPDGVADVSRQGTIPAIRRASPASVAQCFEISSPPPTTLTSPPPTTPTSSPPSTPTGSQPSTPSPTSSFR